MSNQRPIPEGYYKNAQGNLVHQDDIREQDKLRDDLVVGFVKRAQALHKQLAAFKRDALADIDDLIAISAQRYDVTLGGKKGNVQLVSFDGRYKIMRNVQEVITFSEEIEAAKALIDECVSAWSKDAGDNIRALIDHAFRANAQGQIKTSAVLSLMRLDIDDAKWHQAMDAMRDALHVHNTAVYVRVYERVGDSDQWQAITLDLASA